MKPTRGRKKEPKNHDNLQCATESPTEWYEMNENLRWNCCRIVEQANRMNNIFPIKFRSGAVHTVQISGFISFFLFSLPTAWILFLLNSFCNFCFIFPRRWLFFSSVLSAWPNFCTNIAHSNFHFVCALHFLFWRLNNRSFILSPHFILVCMCLPFSLSFVFILFLWFVLFFFICCWFEILRFRCGIVYFGTNAVQCTNELEHAKV